MGQFSKVLLGIDNAHTVPQRALDCGPGLGVLKQVMCPSLAINRFRISVVSISTFVPDVQIAVVDVSKGQTDMSYKGELQTLTIKY